MSGGEVIPPSGEHPSVPDLDLSPDLFLSGKDRKKVSLILHPDAALPLPREVTVSMDGDAELFEGDIVVTPEKQQRPELKSSLYGLSIRKGGGKWPDGIVHYLIENGLEGVVREAIAHWEAHTPIRFSEGLGTGDYASFEDRGRCRSRIGRADSGQVVELKIGCSTGDVIHEIGHVVGLWHEQSRHDRRHYVKVLTENIKDNEEYNFDPHNGTAENRGDYDIKSIMHYPSTAFSKNGKPTIVALDGKLIPSKSGLSRGDIAAVRALYSELAW